MQTHGPRGWHRVFHPLCGADPATLARLVVRHGAPSPAGAARLGVAAATSLFRLPATLGERAWDAATAPPTGPPPVFIVGHMRSGTTHLHNVLAASGHFATVPPVVAGLPWEARSLAPLLAPLLAPYLPATRFFDAVAMRADAPTEDEIALANMSGLSYFHAFYFPRRFRAAYARGLLFEGANVREIAAWERTLRRYVRAMAARAGGRPLLLKNPAYTARIARLRAIWPEARFIHIHRDPATVFASTRRTVRITLDELALQRPEAGTVDEAILDVYPPMMDAALAAIQRLPTGAVVEVPFARLDAQPLAEIDRVWRALALPDRERALARMRRYLASVRGYAKTRHALSGADAARVRARWPRFVDRFGTLPEG